MKKALAILLALSVGGVSAAADSQRVSDSIRQTAMQRKAVVDRLEAELFITDVHLDELYLELEKAEEEALKTDKARIIITVASLLSVVLAAKGLNSALREFHFLKKTRIVSNFKLKAASDPAVGIGRFGLWLVPAYVSYASGKGIVKLTNADVQKIKTDISDAQDEIEAIKTELAKIKP